MDLRSGCAEGSRTTVHDARIFFGRRIPAGRPGMGKRSNVEGWVISPADRHSEARMRVYQWRISVVSSATNMRRADRPYVMLATCIVLMGSCRERNPSDRATNALNRQIVRLTQENVELSTRLKSAEIEQETLRRDLKLLQAKLAYLETSLPNSRTLPSPVSSAPAVTTPSAPPRRGGFTDWSESTVARPTVSPTSPSQRASGTSGTSSARPTSDPTIIAQCSSKWGSNFEMVEYCQKEQQGAKDRLDRGNVYEVSGSVFATIRQQCQQKWGTNFEMREYCEKEQTGAYKRINP